MRIILFCALVTGIAMLAADRFVLLYGHIAILTGGNVVGEELRTKLENITIGLLGRAKKIMIYKEKTTIVDGVHESRKTGQTAVSSPSPST